MNYKLITTLLVMMFLVTTVSAFDFHFDNAKTYDVIKRELVIEDNFKLGEEFARIRLISEQNQRVIAGDNVKVAELEFINYKKDYGTWNNKWEFYNIQRDFKTMEKEVILKYRMTTNVKEIPIYSFDCTGTKPEDISCKDTIIGYDYFPEYEWVEFTSLTELPAGVIRVGLFTEVSPGEHIEWIPTWFGVRIEEWASWQEGFNDGLVRYFRFNETGTDVPIDAVKGKNATLTNNPTHGQVGIIDEAYAYVPASSQSSDMGSDADWQPGTDSFSISVWAKPDAPGTDGRVYGSYDGGGLGVHWQIAIGNAANKAGLYVFDDGGSGFGFANGASNIGSANYTNMIMVINRDTDRALLYLNGSLEINQSIAGLGSLSTGQPINIGEAGFGGVYFDGNIDDFGFWNRSLTGEEANGIYLAGLEGKGYTTSFQAFTLDLNAPLNNEQSINQTQWFSANYSISGENLVNATLNVWNDTGLFNSNLTTITGTTNFTNLSLSNMVITNYTWNYEACGDLGTCIVANSNRTITIIPFVEDSITFQASVSELTNQSFEFNLTYDSANFDSINATLFYAGTGRDVTKSETNNAASFLSSFIIPAGGATNELYWQVKLSNGSTDDFYNSTFNNQTVTGINFTACGSAPQNIPYINFTFQNETVAQESVSAIVSSARFTYWLGDQDTNATTTFSNATENPSYGFCFSPSDQTINIEYSVSYSNSESQQRTFTQTPTQLTNTTTLKTLYLLPTTDGVFNPFVTIDSVSTPIASVLGTITRVLGASTITVDSKLTDDSGLAIYFLDPDITYTASFSKAGLPTNTFTFVPTTDTRNVIMGSTTSNVNGSTISVNTTYSIAPENSTLVNNTDYLFSFTVAGNTQINTTSMNITNSSGAQLSFQTGIGLGTISDTINTANHTRIIGTFTYTDNVETITVTKSWIVGNQFVGEYSIFNQGKLYLLMGFKDIYQYLIIIFVLIALMIYMSSDRTLDNSESKVVVAMMVVWFFSVISWLDVPIVATGAGTLGELSKQYGIAMISSAFGIFFIFRRTFIRRI